MNKNFQQLIKKLKKNPLSEKTTLVSQLKKKSRTPEEIDTVLKLYNSIMANSYPKQDDLVKNILFHQEFVKENIIFGVLTLKRKMSNKINYYTKLIIVDDNNYIDNLLLKKYSSEKAAIKYANELVNFISTKTVDEIVNFIYKQINI